MSQQVQPPSLVSYSSESEYKNHFCRVYCDLNNPIYTFDNIRVNFYPIQFDHAFYESTDRAKGDKSIFSRKRAERIDWIKWALQNRNALLVQGWIKNKKRYDPYRRVCVVVTNYIVVIQLESSLQEAAFITAFVIDDPDHPEKLQLIISSPRWGP